MKRIRIFTLILVVFAFILSGCTAMTTAIKHRDLAINSKMSDTIFLDPVAPDLRTVLVQVKNTSGKSIDIATKITNVLTTRGYFIVSDPQKAHYWLQVNVLYAGKAEPQTIQSMLAQGYGSGLGVLTGGLAGAGIGHSMSDSGQGYMVGGAIGMLAGGLANTVVNAMVTSVTYSVITDVLISEKSDIAVEQQINSDLSQGSETKIKQVVKSTSNLKRYRTRIASTANQVNLEFEDAIPILEASLSEQIAGIM